MTIATLELTPTDINRAALLLIRQSGDSEAIIRAVRRIRECRYEGSERAAQLWEKVNACLRDMVPSHKYPENCPDNVFVLKLAA